MSIIIFTILLLTSFFLYQNRKTEGNVGFWRNLYATISLKVVDYFCKGTPTKVVMAFLRGAFGIYTAASVGYPTVKALYTSDGTKEFFEILLSWDDVNWTFTLIFLIIIAAVIIIYLICNRYESKSIHHIEQTADTINETTTETSRKLDKVLGLLQDKQNTIIQHLLPQTIESIKGLKVKTALSYLTTMKDEVEATYPDDYLLKAELLYWMGCCLRYTDEKKSRETLTEAYEMMKASGKENANIVAGMVYVLCRDGKESEAMELSARLSELDANNIWTLIPKLHFDNDLERAFADIKGLTENPILVLGNELMIRTKELGNIHSIFDECRILLQDDVTFDNLPLWVVMLSAALNQFTQTWTIMPPDSKLSNEESEKLFQLTEKYLVSLKNTEIMNILQDTEYLHALTGYCHDKDKKWIDEMKGCKPTEGHKAIYTISLSAILLDSGESQEALKLLKEFEVDETSAGILHHRIHIALSLGDFDDIKESFALAADRQVVIPDIYLNYFISVARIHYEVVKDYVWRLKIQNPLSEETYHQMLNFFSGKEVDVNFLMENDTEINAIFSPFVALVYQKYVSLDKALEKAKSCVNYHVLDLRTYIYIDLLSSDVSKTKELYHFLKEIRQNGVSGDDRLLVSELNMAEEIQDYDNAVEISAQLVERDPNNAGYLEHRLIALCSCGDHEDDIRSYQNRLSGMTFNDDQVRNIFNVYHIIGEEETALEFLYQNTILHPSQTLRDFFYQVWLNDKFSVLILKQGDEVLEDSYILYTDNDKEIYDVVSRGSSLEDFIGKKPGESIVVKDYKGERILTINAVFNKYFKLVREVQEDISQHKSKTIISFDTKDFNFEKDPLGTLMKIAGRTPEQNDAHKTDLMNYERGQLSLLAFAKDHEPISSLYDLLFGDFCVYSLPDQTVKTLIDNNEINIQDKVIVLDVSSLLLLHELDVQFGVVIPMKLLMPQGIIKMIDSSIIHELKGMPSFFGQRVAQKLKIDQPNDGESLFVTKLRMLKDWAEMNCETVLVEEKLNVDTSTIRMALISLQAESLLLANSRNGILITEDWSFCRQLASVFPSMSVSNLLYTLESNKYQQVAEYLTTCYRSGQIIKSEFICREYEKSVNKELNLYQHCISSIEKNGHLYKEAIEAAVKMTSGIILPATTLATTSLLMAMFKSVPANTVLKLYMFAYRFSDNITYREALTNALRIYRPDFFHEGLQSGM